MNVRIFWVRAMKCMCAETRPRFILSSERVSWGMEFEPMLTPREKSPLPENVPRGGSNPRRCGQRAQTLPMSYSGPPTSISVWQYVKLSEQICPWNTLACCWDIKQPTNNISPTHSILTPGWPVLALTVQHQMGDRVAARIPVVTSLSLGVNMGFDSIPWKNFFQVRV